MLWPRLAAGCRFPGHPWLRRAVPARVPMSRSPVGRRVAVCLDIGAGAVSCAATAPAYGRHAACLPASNTWSGVSVFLAVATAGTNPPLAALAVLVSSAAGTNPPRRSVTARRKLPPVHRLGHPPSDTSSGLRRACRSPGGRAAILLGKHESPRRIATGSRQRRSVERTLLRCPR